MDTEVCHWCQEKFPSEYYFAPEAPAWKRVCRECFAKLPPDERQRVVYGSDTQAGTEEAAEARACPRCQTAMRKGELRAEAPLVWHPAGDRSIWDWLATSGLPVGAWRCGRCGHVEIATEPDPGAFPNPEPRPVRRRRPPDDDPSVL